MNPDSLLDWIDIAVVARKRLMTAPVKMSKNMGISDLTRHHSDVDVWYEFRQYARFLS